MKENKITCIMSGGDNLSGFNNCKITFQLTLDEIKNLTNLEIEIDDVEHRIKEYPEDPIEIGTGSDGTDFYDIIGEIRQKGYSEKEYVKVWRSIIDPDFDDNFLYHERIIECTDQSLEELNKTYYLYGGTSINGTSKNDLSLLSNDDMKRIEEDGFDNIIDGFLGYDLYELENFDLDLELKTGY